MRFAVPIGNLTPVRSSGPTPVRSAGPTPVPSAGATGQAGRAGQAEVTGTTEGFSGYDRVIL